MIIDTTTFDWSQWLALVFLLILAAKGWTVLITNPLINWIEKKWKNE